MLAFCVGQESQNMDKVIRTMKSNEVIMCF